MGALYDACLHAEVRSDSHTGRRSGNDNAFKQLAFEAKIFQRLSRLFAVGISDDNAKEKVKTEVENTLKRFSEMLENILDSLNENDKEDFRKEFLSRTANSPRNLIALLGDFSIVKDYYLVRRDKGESL